MAEPVANEMRKEVYSKLDALLQQYPQPQPVSAANMEQRIYEQSKGIHHVYVMHFTQIAQRIQNGGSSQQRLQQHQGQVMGGMARRIQFPVQDIQQQRAQRMVQPHAAPTSRPIFVGATQHQQQTAPQPQMVFQSAPGGGGMSYAQAHQQAPPQPVTSGVSWAEVQQQQQQTLQPQQQHQIDAAGQPSSAVPLGGSPYTPSQQSHPPGASPGPSTSRYYQTSIPSVSVNTPQSNTNMMDQGAIPQQSGQTVLGVGQITPGAHTHSSQASEQVACQLKLKELSRYSEPLRDYIRSRAPSWPGYTKLQKILEIITMNNPNAIQMTLQQLNGCETLLKKLNMKPVADMPAVAAAGAAVVSDTFTTQHLIGQELLEAIDKRLDDPNLASDLYRKFGHLADSFGYDNMEGILA